MVAKSKQDQWKDFSVIVNNHIEDYVVPQYGDFPDNHLEWMLVEEIKGKLSSYVARIGKVETLRGAKGALQDCLKIAHFACYLFAKQSVGNAQSDISDIVVSSDEL